jgi:hypothetical protein
MLNYNSASKRVAMLLRAREVRAIRWQRLGPQMARLRKPQIEQSAIEVARKPDVVS